mmetsp:Transcript_14233/g.34715  ORF Transcript_14233/g.34715 Transcript_14233/m.34715 type:complete len:584 (-) Transcript_14233:173-1924(-)|eukprot:CAMPEP_0114487384 /NCGR_PEP_ID=MMETSP0109-20121206/736_1 /TAXON_ID=29199 /ORGANISM="Chlorarachnion reptans, Strain CCCM449" /LENGTH=583 /DNA_ID=CAMNT_0001663643 /DNA_START=137 /DNA_END=1888 /DNA_ORIENTATION=-
MNTHIAPSNASGTYMHVTDNSKPVSTESTEAQQWFDNGLAWLYGFNHVEAIHCFREALVHDPQLAIAHWGVGYAMGTNYNYPVIDDPQGAYKAAQMAVEMARKTKINGVEKDLIEALSVRYEETMHDSKKDSKKAQEQLCRLQTQYQLAMEKVYVKFCGEDSKNGGDPDVAALYAEAIMNRKPWELWVPEPETGKPPEYSFVAQRVLERHRKFFPKHPGLCHLYVHLMELSSTPEKALPAADVLRNDGGDTPGSGHLLHMASHIDMWVGAYANAIRANKLAHKSDQEYVRVTGRKGGFYASYRGHNIHFIAWAAMFDGQFKTAWDAGQRILECFDWDVVSEMPKYLESFRTVPLMVLIRFGKWKEIIDHPLPDAKRWPCILATQRYARGVAFAALGDVTNARIEQKLFLDMVHSNRYLHECMFVNNNVAWDPKGKCGSLNVGAALLEGEILYREHKFESAFKSLRDAVRLEDDLKYDEPWGWMQPTRHALGALLNEQKRYGEAKSVFEADLKKWPKNLWATMGLMQSLKGLGNIEKAGKLEEELKDLTRRADVSTDAACLCANGIFDTNTTTKTPACCSLAST